MLVRYRINLSDQVPLVEGSRSGQNKVRRGDVISPFDPVRERLCDRDDWISFPAFYAHVVVRQDEGTEQGYAVRTRGSDGRLCVISDATPDLAVAQKSVERYWVELLRSCSIIALDDVKDEVRRRVRQLEDMELAAEWLTPADARSPFRCIPYEEWRTMDPTQFPVGFPIIVEQRGRSRLSDQEVILHSPNRQFAHYRDYNGKFDEAHRLVRDILIYNILVRESFRLAYESDDECRRDYFKFDRHLKQVDITENGEFEAEARAPHLYPRP